MWPVGHLRSQPRRQALALGQARGNRLQKDVLSVPTPVSATGTCLPPTVFHCRSLMKKIPQMWACKGSPPKQGSLKSLPDAGFKSKATLQPSRLRRHAGAFRAQTEGGVCPGPRSNAARRRHRFAAGIRRHFWSDLVPGKLPPRLEGTSLLVPACTVLTPSGALGQSSPSPSGRWASPGPRADDYEATSHGSLQAEGLCQASGLSVAVLAAPGHGEQGA